MHPSNICKVSWARGRHRWWCRAGTCCLRIPERSKSDWSARWVLPGKSGSWAISICVVFNVSHCQSNKVRLVTSNFQSPLPDMLSLIDRSCFTSSIPEKLAKMVLGFSFTTWISAKLHGWAASSTTPWCCRWCQGRPRHKGPLSMVTRPVRLHFWSFSKKILVLRLSCWPTWNPCKRVCFFWSRERIETLLVGDCWILEKSCCRVIAAWVTRL